MRVKAELSLLRDRAVMLFSPAAESLRGGAEYYGTSETSLEAQVVRTADKPPKNQTG